MGGSPRLALNILCIPETMDISVAGKILAGGNDKIREAGAVLSGGHSLRDKEPKYGLAVTGFVHPDHILRNVGLMDGDVLILTKPLGTGILNTAAKAGLIGKAECDRLLASMKALNRKAAEVMLRFHPHCCTDVTGFGLLGHGYEMASGSGKSMVIDSTSVPLLPGAVKMADMGIIPKGAYGNRKWLSCAVRTASDLPLAVADILFDPQTSGGLLFAVSEEEAERCLLEMKMFIPDAARIGYVQGPKTDSNSYVEVR